MSAAATEFEPPVLEAPPPDRIGKYQVIRKLGDGATSEVYLCHDPFAGRDVAVKIVYQDRLNDPQRGKLFRKLFVTEASLAGKLSHPHIAQIFDAVVGDKMSYIVMEYVAGGTLEPFCAPENLLPLDKTVEIIFKCDARPRLRAQARRDPPRHQAGEHPAVGAGGTDIKITDFGSAIMSTGDTTQVTGIGSPAYMSPQQIKEQPLDHRTDIYSLGVVMYQLLTGVLPFNARNNFSMMYQITTVEPAPPSSHRKEIPPALDAIVRKAMAKDLESRYQTWDDFSFDLAEIFRSEEIRRRSDEVADSEKFNTLRAMPFFAEFTDAELWEVLRISSWQDAAPGDRAHLRRRHRRLLLHPRLGRGEGHQAAEAPEHPQRRRVLRRDVLSLAPVERAQRRRDRACRLARHHHPRGRPRPCVGCVPAPLRPRVHVDPGGAADAREQPPDGGVISGAGTAPCCPTLSAPPSRPRSAARPARRSRSGARPR